MDKDNDGFVTLNELNEFLRAIYKEKHLTQGEVRTQHRMLKNLYVKNLYPKDMLGPDNQFDFDEYWYLINTPTTTP